MRREPLTPKKRAQFDEMTRGQEVVAMVALVLGGVVFVLLNEATQRALFIALALPAAAFSAIAFRNAGAFSKMGLKEHHRQSMWAAVILGVLAVGLIVAGEVLVRMRGVA